MCEYVYSSELETMVVKRFKLKKHIYEWSDRDAVYYREDTDEDYFMSIPYYLGAVAL